MVTTVLQNMKFLVCFLAFVGLFRAAYGSHNTNVNTGSRLPLDRPNNEYPTSKNDRWPYDSKYFLPDSDLSYGNTQEGNKQGCTAANTYREYVPTGRTKVSYITIMDQKGLTMEQCMRGCCDKGPATCQYAWIFEGQCIHIGCTQEDSGLCKPLKFSRQGLNSLYVEVNHYGSDSLSTDGEVSTEPQTTIPQETERTLGTTTIIPIATTTITDEEETPTNQVTPLERPQGTTRVIAVTPSQEPQTTESETPPITTSTPHTLPVTTQKTKTNEHGIFVATDGDTDITLPINTAKLFGNTWPKPPFPEAYIYKWEKLSGPEQGTVLGKDIKDVVLRGLVPGVYLLKLKVQSWVGSEWGEGFINITVHEATHVNSPPVPVILPSNNAQITLPQDSIVLDAGTSDDDRGREELKFHWEEVAGPLGSNLEVDLPLLRLSGLTEGVHLYKLTVTDSDGAVSVATANVTVLAEKDYPPMAHAGNPVILHLPNDEATLDGSQSKDEGVLKYKWTYLSGPGGGDMEGANTPKLHVKHLPLGDHQYQLTVTDSSGQTSTDTVSVIVTAEKNTPPIAVAGGNVTVVFPLSVAVLNGSRSVDDYLISSFGWSQIGGPTDVELSGVDTNTLTVSSLHIDESVGSPTYYQFQLTVTDYRNLTDTDIATVIFKKNPKIPPVASAGPDVNITLPQSTAVLDGKGSRDDFGIVSYQWVRCENSPAAGRVVDKSDQKPTLILSGLVNGTYNFTLNVTNKNGESAQDNVTLRVLPNPIDRFLLQVHIEGDIALFSQVDEEHFKRTLSYLLYDGTEDYDISVETISSFNSHIMVEFYAQHRSNKKMMNTTDAFYKLTEKGQDYKSTSFHIVKVDMKVCQLPCSGHGTCNLKTKKCQCSTFWMENPFKSRFDKMESNCEWSVFYVVLIIVGVAAVFLFCLWLCCCCCIRRRRRSRTKRRIRYAILDNKDQDPESIQMLPRDYKKTSLMVSESDTEEEILFESPRKTLNNDTGKGTKNNKSSKVRNGKIITGEDKVGNQSLSNNNSDSHTQS